MTILDLSLTYHYYDEIESGRKKEEYRENKPFYRKRFCRAYSRECLDSIDEICGLWCPIRYKHYDAIRFHRGQGSKRIMLVECKNIRLGYGNPEWGAPTDREVFILKLGNIL